MFRQLIDHVKSEVTKVLLTVEVRSKDELEQAAGAMEDRAESITNMTYSAPTETGEVEVKSAHAAEQPLPADLKVGRNEPCPCGSGKKYKHCHGKLV